MGNSKIVYGAKTLIDLTGDTVKAENLKSGETAHDKAGNLIVGILEAGAYDVTSTDNGDGTQTIKIVDAGGSAGEPTTIQPLTVTENGTYTAPDGVDGYSPVTVEVSTGGSAEPPAVGFVPSAWDADGYITDGTWYGTVIPDYCCYSQSSRPYRFSNVVLPDRIKKIGNNAFYGCNSIMSISLPNSLIEIGSAAFRSCAYIKIQSLPDGVVSIGSNAFNGCSTNVTLSRLPNSVETVGSSAFYNCNKISSFTINAGLKVVPETIVVSSELTSVFFLGTPVSIDSGAFSYNTNLTNINVPWSEGEVANAPWGATNATINYNYTGE